MEYFQIKINKHGWIYLIVILLLTIVFYPFIPFLSIIFFIILIFTAYFFRDPDKVVPIDDNLILSPADGVITYIGEASAPSELDQDDIRYNKISIFLNVFDIHINRVPATGKILRCQYIKGKFYNATLDKSSTDNERNIILMEAKKNKIIFVQIAGLIARRIVSDLKIGQEVNQGDRYGLIKFGSRVDLYISKEIKFHVSKGQRVIGGETIIADLNNSLNIKESKKK